MRSRAIFHISTPNASPNRLTHDRGLSRLARGKRQEARGKRQEARGKRQEARGKRQEARGKRQEARGKRQEARGKRQEARGKRQEARGKRQEARGKRQEARGKRQEARGKRQEARGKRQEGWPSHVLPLTFHLFGRCVVLARRYKRLKPGNFKCRGTNTSWTIAALRLWVICANSCVPQRYSGWYRRILRFTGTGHCKANCAALGMCVFSLEIRHRWARWIPVESRNNPLR